MFYPLLVRFCLSFLLTLHFILVSISLLHEKRKELGDAASKLRNGLDKIDDTRAKVWPFVVQFYLTVHELDLFFMGKHCQIFQYGKIREQKVCSYKTA